MAFNPGMSGISGASDIALGSKVDGEVLTYDSSWDKWRNKPNNPAVGGDLSGTASSAQIITNAVTSTKIADNAVTEPKLAVANAPVSGQVLSWNGSQFQWVAQTGGGGGGSASAYECFTVRESGGTIPARSVVTSDISKTVYVMASFNPYGGSYGYIAGVDVWLQPTP